MREFDVMFSLHASSVSWCAVLPPAVRQGRQQPRRRVGAMNDVVAWFVTP
jgi:hypothetical protein